MRHELATDIEIDAPLERVWARLRDFDAYASWNPFVRRIRGQLAPGNELEVQLTPPDAPAMTLKPRVTALSEGRSFAWSGRLLIPGLFDGEHHFVLEPLDAQRTRFRHFERFSGVLVPLLKSMLETKVRAGFVAMNEALKAEVEARA